MSQVIPEGEAVRKAVKWISCECKEDENYNINKLIINASMKFNLSPKDEEFLRAFYFSSKGKECNG